MTAEKRSILQPSENPKEFQAATCESTDAIASSARISRHSEVKVRVWISTDKRYDSIGNAPGGIVGVGQTLIPGHFRLGRLDEAAGVCGGRGPSMGFELGS
jgi:hypothetical protein